MAANPLVALNAINPSLVGYMGGYGKALQSIGNTMANMGQVKLDLQKQNDETNYRNAMLKLSQNADDRATADQQEKFTDKQNKFAGNVAANSYLLGQDMPQEMSNDYARLSLIDPNITAAAIKREKDKFSATDGGLIYNTATGQMVNDYRDKGGNLAKLPYADTMVKGVLTRNFINEDGKITSIAIPGTTQGIYSQYVTDSIGDTNTGQRPVIANTTKQNIGGSNVIANGGMPIVFSKDPSIAAAQRKYALPLDGGGWYVPSDMKNDYMKAFPK